MEWLFRMEWLTLAGRVFLGVLSSLGQIATLMGELVIALRSGVWRLRLVARQIVAMSGYGSQFVVVVTGAFTGAVFAFQSYAKFKTVRPGIQRGGDCLGGVVP
jgi:phospholipid/cholesterol/gamma-HCH transport system permease protein